MGFLTDDHGLPPQTAPRPPPDERATGGRGGPGVAAPRPPGALRAAARDRGVAVIARSSAPPLRRGRSSARRIRRAGPPPTRWGVRPRSPCSPSRTTSGGRSTISARCGAAVHAGAPEGLPAWNPPRCIEARAAGADAVLLIAAALPDDRLDAMLEIARRLGMEPLLETHTEEDLERALATDAAVVGRERPGPGVARGGRRSGSPTVGAHPPRPRRGPRVGRYSTPADVAAAVDAGASAILVGEALMRAADPARTLSELLAGARSHPPGKEPAP